MYESSIYLHNQRKLRQLMQQAEISSLKELSRLSGVSQWQINRLLTGLLPKLSIINILKLSQVLKISPEELFLEFETAEYLKDDWKITAQVMSGDNSISVESLQKELNQQQENLQQEFQASSIATLESWLLQWPTATTVAKKNPEISAVKLLPLVQPIFELLKQWGVEIKGTVGEVVSYNPQFHQLLEGGGSVEIGDPVVIRYVGYDHNHKLLYRAKVSPVKKDNQQTTTTNESV
ncbi:helix-turn-helix domain-containing protein [Crocosphaera sp. Alani8]|uniref:helix-turn-helix domain-containing protein n=1 Tax=Crocosphaera sp. Alani8 TaxID=3038952 RepID=UPI00313E45DA